MTGRGEQSADHTGLTLRPAAVPADAVDQAAEKRALSSPSSPFRHHSFASDGKGA